MKRLFYISLLLVCGKIYCQEFMITDSNKNHVYGLVNNVLNRFENDSRNRFVNVQVIQRIIIADNLTWENDYIEFTLAENQDGFNLYIYQGKLHFYLTVTIRSFQLEYPPFIINKNSTGIHTFDNRIIQTSYGYSYDLQKRNDKDDFLRYIRFLLDRL